MAAFLCRPVGVGTGAVTAPAAGNWTSTKPGLESQQAFDLLEQRLPGTKGDEASARGGTAVLALLGKAACRPARSLDGVLPVIGGEGLTHRALAAPASAEPDAREAARL
ncbi:hypothetical protein [Streptomyces sp. NPDC057257]|uniref:hypothetical protein n=1 Tax=Streptomyces sp. NPDC057257 TaxID=3346071 RepID=UPI003631123B